MKWDPITEEFGALPFLYGTLMTTVIALFLAVPIGLGTAIFLAEFPLRGISQRLILFVELLAAIPSVIYGLVAIFVLVPWVREVLGPFLTNTLGFLPIFRGTSYGVGVLTAGLVLAVMIVPFVAAISREVLMAVPRSQREAALALGATQWETLWMVILPYARSGILASVMLALARALGETMAVTMVIGNRPQIARSLLDPGYTMSAVLANEFTEATEDNYLHALVYIGFVLFCVTFVVNAIARLIFRRFEVSREATQ